MSLIQTEKGRNALNLFLFITGWLACVFSSGNWPYIATLIILIIHFKWIGSWEKEREVVFITLLAGSIIDSVSGNLGLLSFPELIEPSRILPGWMACIWLLLGTTIRHGLAWGASRVVLMAVTGAVAAAVHYFFINEFTTVELEQPELKNLIILAMVWMLTLPVLQAFSKIWLERHRRQTTGI